ncbi:DgyrCDS5293 [Dimorphilus gyrociliatus]|uniref:DgyrCDS5293 n=1 Tax=Dimorphilus gyrociliatus TaxID=2664684 RepID=A0A7I8VL32_9ANNE|nr:DgyrCDS5293 [Dimorphilus gyrociliatus]
MSSSHKPKIMFPAFAAYQNSSPNKEENTIQDSSLEWLNSKSYIAPSQEIEEKSSESNSLDGEPRRKKKKKKEKKAKHKKVKKERSPPPKRERPSTKREKPKDYFKDTIPDRNTLQFGCLYEKDVPKYKRPSSYTLGVRSRKNFPSSKLERYHMKKIRKLIKKDGESVKLDKGFKFIGQEFIAFSKWECDNEQEFQPFDLIRKLEHQVQTDPADIDSWFKLAEAHSQNQAVLNEDAKLDMMESVLQKAREKNPANVEILTHFLNRKKTVDDQEWKKILFNHMNDERVWQVYLNYNTYRQMSFNIRNIANVFTKCIKDFKRILDGHVLTHPPRKDANKYLLSFFSMYCSVLKRSGSSEKALATWQAFLELNFNCPDNLVNSALNTQFYFLDQFWDSGVPRIGEKHSVGWKNSTNQSVVEPSAALNEDELVEKYKNKGESRVWLALEKLRENSHYLSCRKDDEVDDYERIILFDDVKDFLFINNDKRQILELVGEFFEISPSPYDIITEMNFKMAPVSSWMSGIAELILEHMANILENFDNELLEYWITKWFDYLIRSQDKKSIKKAKNILCMEFCKSNSFFWAKLAQLLCKHDRRIEAEQVIEQTKRRCVKCCNIYAQIYLGILGGQMNKEKARNVLGIVVDFERVATDIDILRTKNSFEERILAVTSPHLDISYAMFLYAIDYVKSAFDFLEARLRVYENNMDHFRIVTDLRVRLAQHYLSTDPTAAPKILNSCIFEAIKKFPREVDYHCAFLKLKNERILRNFLDELISNKEYCEIETIHVTRALLEIEADNVERTFSVLEEAVAKCPRSTIIWRMLMYYTAKKKTSENVEKIFHRSLQSCVPDKILYTDFVLLVPKSVQLVTDLLTEKLMRIRTPLEEVRVLIE